jgi:hypothetical protein
MVICASAVLLWWVGVVVPAYILGLLFLVSAVVVLSAVRSYKIEV